MNSFPPDKSSRTAKFYNEIVVVTPFLSQISDGSEDNEINYNYYKS